ncbi:MAG: GNAT family N-acetyltransferase [Chloroflexota bacterium]
MEGLSVRPAVSSDIPDLIALDHSYSTDHVWQMDYRRLPDEVAATFRQVRLPRPMRVSYPRDPLRLADDWTRRLGLFVAEQGEARRGYLALAEGTGEAAAWVTDLVVGLRDRRQGIATKLLAAAWDWCRQQGLKRLFLEMQSKNYPAICLARKLGFVFSGYSDHYYRNEDIALFFSLDLD